MLLVLLLSVMNVRGESSNTKILTGDIMDKEKMLDPIGKDQGPSTLVAAITCKLELAAFFGEYEVGAKLALQKGETVAKVMVGLQNSIHCCFMGGLHLFFMTRKIRKEHVKGQAQKY
jgi:hypothetical protein